MKSAVLMLVFGVGIAAAQRVPGTVPATGVGSGPVSGVSGYSIIPTTEPPTIGPGEMTLLELEGKFAKAVAEGGGRAFAEWFADDAVTLSNGKPAVVGRGAIARDANWSPKEYSLTWTPQGAQMSPGNDMGFTWGHYEGKSMGLDGKPVVVTGRYITVWKKNAAGVWRVAMDASADEPKPADCCSLKP